MRPHQNFRICCKGRSKVLQRVRVNNLLSPHKELLTIPHHWAIYLATVGC